MRRDGPEISCALHYITLHRTTLPYATLHQRTKVPRGGTVWPQNNGVPSATPLQGVGGFSTGKFLS